jgi:hypothetical protein
MSIPHPRGGIDTATYDDHRCESVDTLPECWRNDTSVHFFNLQEDPSESYDLMLDDDNARIATDIVADLTEKYDAWEEIARNTEPAVAGYVLIPDEQAIAIFNEAGGLVPSLDADDNYLPLDELGADFIPAPPSGDDIRTNGLVQVDGSAPNIVFILVDDWGYNAAGPTSTFLEWTQPHLTKMFSEGVVLDNYYTAWSCAPSRAVLMTGRNTVNLGISNRKQRSILEEPEAGYSSYPLQMQETTIADEMRSVGYRTALVGKWHLGFDHWAETPR